MLSTARQVAKVTVKGWDRARKKPIKVTVDTSDREVKRVNPDLHRLVAFSDPAKIPQEVREKLDRLKVLFDNSRPNEEA